MIPVLSGLGYRLARFLSQTDEEQESIATCSREALEAALQPGDVLLIDGTSRISMAIKYITQSTWSHEEILHIRHHSLFAPRDFDVSPYFQIIKPSIFNGFDHHALTWAKE
ncbi:hypothetical protein [Fodinibius sp.]|uniref:hypothetical protein n=1 Tax=Fodinibius sp. TaxID=1872440 RepID=UPI003561B35A